MVETGLHATTTPGERPTRAGVGFVPVPACWICGHTAFRPMDRAPLNFAHYATQDPELAAYTGVSVRIMQCKGCGFGQPEKLPALPNYFDRAYDIRWSNETLEQEFGSAYKDLIFNLILDELERRLGRGRRSILDVGAHAGRFIHLASRRGMAAEGIELNPQSSAYAERATGLPVHRLNAHDLAVRGNRYDAVTMTDVLEHIPEPLRILEKLHTLLVPGGWIAVKVPHGRAQWVKERLVRRLIHRRGTDFGGIADNLVHVNQFGAKSLRLALTRAGFTEIAIEVGAPEVQVLGTWRDTMANLPRIGVWRAAQFIPGSTRTPLALNLQAFARRG
jgi:SAM-dependent methyltransferase